MSITTNTTVDLLSLPIYERLSGIRLAAGLTKLALARITGISVRAINYYESADYTRGRKKATVKQWAEACGRTLEDVWPSDDDAADMRGKAFPCITDAPRFGSTRHLAIAS